MIDRFVSPDPTSNLLNPPR